MTNNKHLVNAMITAKLVGNAKTMQDKIQLVHCWASSIRSAIKHEAAKRGGMANG